MKRISLLKGGLWGGITAIAVIALTYLGERLLGWPFPPFDLFDWMARVLPGPVITAGIDAIVALITGLNLGSISGTAKLVEQSIALVQFALIGVVFGVVLAALARRKPRWSVFFGLGGGALLAAGAILIEIDLGYHPIGMIAIVISLAAIFLGWGAVLGSLVRGAAPQPEVEEAEGGLSRRQFMYLVGAGSFTLVVSALGVSLLSEDSEAQESADMMEDIGAGNTSGPAASPPQEQLNARTEPAPGTRPELTANEDFYRIDINTRPPEVDAETWRLELGGLVDNPLELTLEEIRSRPSFSQAITLSCISNSVGGDLISTSKWTGVRLKDLLDEAGLRAGAREVAIESVDGFYESVPMEEAMDDRTLLVYAMNDQPLPTEHGFPLRIYIPDHYGMKQPKWITRMEVIDTEGPGYWVDRGWSPTAIVKTTSVVDPIGVSQIEAGAILPVGGIAYAGARGISRVEVRVDGGEWQEVQLRTPPLSPLTWVQWRFDWPAEMGRHTFEVRAYDGNGDLQVTEDTPKRPDGATGIHSRSARI